MLLFDILVLSTFIFVIFLFLIFLKKGKESDSQRFELVLKNIRNLYLKDFDICEMQKGTSTGVFEVILPDGNTETKKIEDKPSFYMRVVFKEGQKKDIFFSLEEKYIFWTSKDAKFFGTFTPYYPDKNGEILPMLVEKR